MKQYPTRLCLKPGVTFTERDGRIGLSLGGHLRFAQGALQTAILRQLRQGTPTPEGLTQQLCTLQTPPCGTSDAALALASFILDFQDYL